jgi:hypothetical protein
MAALDDLLSFPLHESFNHDLAIQRFCPARVEQERGDQWEWDEKEPCSPSDATAVLPCLPASEVDEFVDSFINMDHYDKDETEAFSMVNDDVLMEEDDEFEDFHGGFPGMVPGVEEVSHGVDQGLHLVQCCWLVPRLWGAGTPNLQAQFSHKSGIQLLLLGIHCNESPIALQRDWSPGYHFCRLMQMEHSQTVP